ncbi:DUF3278 domain-containing protein [Romboutsia maritimum]|uniref:DUF3278 domain-containing protein n=1 Tax=Romboutsia maritimum TaxID=2020948 RepID=A0A371IQ83_9FIRM|nr:DUF3278 domain-containing protein [Romboutsia maritimum]RDY22644.1 DUF3278 domain-containing protein [Romboutsia maritimum]
MKRLEEKLFKHYIGYLEERDEYQQSVIYKTLAKANMYSFYLISLLMMVSLIFDSVNHRFTFGTVALFFIQQFNAYYVSIKLRKSGVDTTEFDDNTTYLIQLKKLKKQARMAGIQWGLSMLIMMDYIFPALEGEKIKLDLISVIVWTCGGALFGGVMYLFGKLKLTRVDNNN